MTLRDEAIQAISDEMERKDGSARNALDGLLGWLHDNDDRIEAASGNGPWRRSAVVGVGHLQELCLMLSGEGS